VQAPNRRAAPGHGYDSARLRIDQREAAGGGGCAHPRWRSEHRVVAADTQLHLPAGDDVQTDDHGAGMGPPVELPGDLTGLLGTRAAGRAQRWLSSSHPPSVIKIKPTRPSTTGTIRRNRPTRLSVDDVLSAMAGMYGPQRRVQPVRPVKDRRAELVDGPLEI
jgi:hypothetical protein